VKARILIALRLTVVTIVLTGVIYPLGLTAIARLAFPAYSAGSIVYSDGDAVGSALIAQPFEGDAYFHPRPSACDYDAEASAASNLGPTSAELRSLVIERVREVRSRESLAAGASVPVDLVCASASGLDPHLSPEAARLQAPRVAEERGIGVQEVLGLIDEHTEHPTLGFIGADRVNVLLLNLALDEATAAQRNGDR
jgi:K+-transporting ATPase ATPase C chain